MQSVGTRLREARIKKGYTLEEINSRTRISLKNLNAIESDDLSKISSPFTYRSFVKQMADLLGVDHATLAADALTASSTMPEPLVPGQEEEVYVRPHQYQKQLKPKSNPNWLRMASIAGVAGVVSVYLIWRNGGVIASKLPAGPLPASSRIVSPAESAPAAMQPSELQTSVPAVAPSTVPNTVQPGVKTESQTPEPEVPAPPPPPPGTEQLLPPSKLPAHLESVAQTLTATPDPVTQAVSPRTGSLSQNSEIAAIHIELSAMQPTWLSISADGKTTYSGTLAAMKTISFEGKETAEIRTVNAGGVNIIFNGRALGPLGRRGQSRTFVFTKSGYEVLHGVSSNLPHVVPTGG